MKREKIVCGCEGEKCIAVIANGTCLYEHTRLFCICGDDDCFIRSDNSPTKNIPYDKGIIGGFAYEFPCGNLRMGNVEDGIIKHRFFTPSLELMEQSV